MPNVQKGIKKAEERAEENSASGFYRVKTLFMKDGEGPWFLRFLTELDDMITADTHGYCETKPKPAEYTGSKWQDHMPAICQNDKMFRVHDTDGKPTDVYEDGYGNCYIHNRDRGKVRDGKFKRDKSLPDTQTYALAAVREPILDPVTHRPVGYRDAMDEFRKEDGAIIQIPRIVIVSQKYRNFWSGVEAALFEGGDLGARDVKVTRKDKDYSFGVSSLDQKLFPGSPDWGRYAEALALAEFNLEEYILKMASDDWYARWFDPDKTPKDGYGRKEDPEEESSATAAQEDTRPDPERVNAFAAQLQAARTGAVASA